MRDSRDRSGARPRGELWFVLASIFVTSVFFFTLSLKFYKIYHSRTHPRVFDSFSGIPRTPAPATPRPTRSPEATRPPAATRPPRAAVPGEPGRTSIAFYIIAGATQKITGEDLRGKFWEWQLPEFPGTYSVHYLSDGPLSVNGVDFLVLPEGSTAYDDHQFCKRTPETWKHFMKYNPDVKWYFRGTHDTFVNVTALTEMLIELEAKADPMTQFNFAFNFHEYNLQYYPHGGTGWLFSNYAVKQFMTKVETFVAACSGSFDDVTMTWFLSQFGQNIMDYQTNKFIVTWPNHMLDIIFNKQWDKIQKCPDTYHLYRGAPGLVPCPCRTAVSIHMHRVPMEQAYKVLSETPENFRVFFPNPNVPTFCHI
jgi:hypothetical protein